MTNFEIDDCLRTMQIIVDTREQPSKRAQDRYDSFRCPYRRQTMSFGDYTYNFKLPNGKWLYDENNTITADVVIERKADLAELSQCFCQSRARFEREFEKVAKHNATVYLLVENATWENLINGKYKTKFNPSAFFASMVAWIARYNIKPILCKAETSGRIIHEILYRELKEKLKRGVYDGFCED